MKKVVLVPLIMLVCLVAGVTVAFCILSISSAYKPLEPIAAKAPTCMEQGNVAHYINPKNGLLYSDSKGENELKADEVIISALGHSFLYYDVKLPTCTQEGNTEYWQCTRCGKYFSDAYGNTEIGDNEIIIERTGGHKYNAVTNTGEWVWTIDCSAANLKYSCMVCNEQQEVQATISVREIAPKCEKIGFKNYKATAIIDDIVYSNEKSVEIPASGHTKVIDIGVLPDCTHTGLTDGCHCSICGVTIIAQEILEKKEHDYDSIITDPTFTEQGYTSFKCKNCRFSYVGEIVDALLSYSLSEDDGSSYVVTSCNITSKMAVIVPEKYKNLSVSSIGESAFADNTFIMSIALPDTIKSIRKLAFSGCSSLVSAKLSEQLTSIGNSAFSGCVALKNIDIPASVKTIGSSAFEKCTKLTSIELQNSVETIGSAAFSGCSSLISITLPFVGGGVKSASDQYQYPFGYIFGTTSYIGGTATGQTTGQLYSTYYIPASLESVIILGGDIFVGAFRNCKVKNITVPSSLKTIEKYAFYGCSALESFTIPDSVESIEYMAFVGCRRLKSIVIPDSVIYLGECAFSSCEALESVVISKEITSLENVFSSCKSLKSITIPDKVTNINGAFFMCESLERIYLPKSIKTMESAFANIANDDFEREVYYDGTLEDWCNLQFNGVDDTPLIYQGHFYLINSSKEYEEVTNLIIPNSISRIGNYQFYGFSFLKSVTIPNSITAIGNNAFCKCVQLTSIDIAGNVSAIGDEAFYLCSSLSKIVIGSNVKSIGKKAFVGCYSWAEVTFKTTNGWWVSTVSSATSGIGIPSSQLAVRSQANIYLSGSNYYADYYWKRS